MMMSVMMSVFMMEGMGSMVKRSIEIVNSTLRFNDRWGHNGDMTTRRQNLGYSSDDLLRLRSDSWNNASTEARIKGRLEKWKRGLTI